MNVRIKVINVGEKPQMLTLFGQFDNRLLPENICLIYQHGSATYFDIKKHWLDGAIIKDINSIDDVPLTIHLTDAYKKPVTIQPDKKLGSQFSTNAESFISFIAPGLKEFEITFFMTPINGGFFENTRSISVKSEKDDLQALEKEFILKIRKVIDLTLNSFHLILPSREVSLAKTSLQLGFSWLGESLKYLGSTSPYIESENPASNKIEPLADHTESNLSGEFYKIEQTQTARIKCFRQELSAVIKNLKENVSNNVILNRDCENCLNYALKALVETKMWFGWELGRIRDLKEGKNTQTKIVDNLQL